MVSEGGIPVVEFKSAVTGAFVDASFEVLVTVGAAIFEDEVVATEGDEAGADMVGVNKVFCCVAVGDVEGAEFVCHGVLVIEVACLDAFLDFKREV